VPDGDQRLQLVIDLAQSEIADQWAGAVGLDGMAVGVLLFDSALAGSIVAVANIHPSPLDGSWGYPLVGLLGSAVLAFITATIGRLTTGPKLAAMHAEIQQLEGAEAIATAQRAAVDRLLATIESNRAVVKKKETALGFALVLLALTFLGYGLYAGKDLSRSVLSGSLNLLVALMSSHGQLAGLLLAACLAVLTLLIYAREG
jgi:hypothetical protein